MRDDIKVMIVDDHPLIRMAVRTVLTEAGMTVVGECGDGAPVVQTAETAGPDVVILDVETPGRSGTRSRGPWWPVGQDPAADRDRVGRPADTAAGGGGHRRLCGQDG